MSLSKSRIQKIINNVQANDKTIHLTDDQIAWVKDKVAIVEAWKDSAITKLIQIDDRLDTIEAAGIALKNRVDNMEAQVTAVLTDHAKRIKALEDLHK